VAAQVGNDYAMSRGELIGDRLEHLAGDHHSMQEHERRARPSFGEVEKL
jgi:hypothetical protein